MMKRVLKKECAIIESQDLIREEQQRMGYVQLLTAYQSLLNKHSELAKIDDNSQGKRFDANSEIENKKKQLYKISVTDYLTGCYNRYYILEALEIEFLRSERYLSCVSCILINIDDFKSINMRYGPQVGDFALKTIAEMIQSSIREVDIFGRYSGEEFLVILPNTRVYDAAIVAEKIRKNIAQLKFETGSAEVGSFLLTLSLGVSDIHSGDPKTAEELLCHVAKALCQAKRNNKNQYVIYS
ncbi:MAG: diguanylate cyclase [Methyloprofundus sp.]|nr:diguanylate cyclase [Methyloprofundus sp.]